MEAAPSSEHQNQLTRLHDVEAQKTTSIV